MKEAKLRLKYPEFFDKREEAEASPSYLSCVECVSIDSDLYNVCMWKDGTPTPGNYDGTDGNPISIVSSTEGYTPIKKRDVQRIHSRMSSVSPWREMLLPKEVAEYFVTGGTFTQ